ncbi:hypothetical protein IC575_018456 [Cucumis melo]|uniref:Cysteine-rich receptor-like protein kinase 44 n=1 Tax=Cucumis melo TaxID=3656 RepID=A0ABM3L3H2_CUCME|nr:cysteine-rich receptor-like protein kinase 44 [Cucumis melo]
MGTPKNFLFLCFILVFMVATTISQREIVARSCSNSGNYTTNSIYKQNLDTLLSSIASNTDIDYGFYNFSEGQQPDRVNAIALCLADLTVEECRSCIRNSTRRILEDCPNQKEAIGWYTVCMVRYSNRSIFGVWVDRVLGPTFVSGRTTSDIDVYTRSLRTLLQRLRNEAASGDSRHKYAVGEIEATNLDNIFGFVQCTPDLSSMDCNNCLMKAAENVPNGSTGTRIFSTNCFLRYETNDIFYDIQSLPPTAGGGGATSPPMSSPPPPPPLPPKPGITARTVIIIVVSIVSVIILVVAIFIILRLRKRKNRKSTDKFEGVVIGDTTDEISSVETIQFDFETIKIATNDFSSENKLGQGGFGAVYKGKLPNGQRIAVKRLANNSQQGDVEFKNEVLLVVKLQHRNLVRLLGFCLQKTERLLIYEFVPNASLDQFIFDFTKRTLLDWERRFKIINGTARGLLYLHEDSRLRIIHRDLKASNILLDEEMNPKIADFGMARLFEVDETQGNTSRIVGTYGYMAPEYLMHGQFSVKSDVFSFGVLILEIVSGKKNNCFRNGEKIEDLSSFAWKNWKAGTTKNVIDSTLSVGSNVEMLRCIHIGLLCVQENAADRPTMAAVVLMLSSMSLNLPVPLEPAFFMHSNVDESTTQSKINQWLEMNEKASDHSESVPLQSLSNDASISELNPR